MTLLISVWLLVAPYVSGPRVPLSLTPIGPLSIAGEDVREACPKGQAPIALRGAPRGCGRLALRTELQQLNRTIRRLRRDMERQLRQEQPTR